MTELLIFAAIVYLFLAWTLCALAGIAVLSFFLFKGAWWYVKASL